MPCLRAPSLLFVKETQAQNTGVGQIFPFRPLVQALMEQPAQPGILSMAFSLTPEKVVVWWIDKPSNGYITFPLWPSCPFSSFGEILLPVPAGSTRTGLVRAINLQGARPCAPCPYLTRKTIFYLPNAGRNPEDALLCSGWQS